MNELMEAVITGLVVLIAGAMLAVVLIEWAAGCGETYVDAYGQRHAYECVIVNN